MHVFRTALKIVAAHRLYILIYLVLMSMFGLFTGQPSDSTTDQNASSAPTVAVIDRDGSTISQGVASYVESVGTVQTVADTKRALQDATAQNTIQYILIIPQGYGNTLEQAANNGEDAPALETIVSYKSAEGSLMDARTEAYLNQVYNQIAIAQSSPAEAVASAQETMAQTAEVKSIEQDTTPLPNNLIIFLRFSIYPIFAFCVISISVFMTTLNRREVAGRLRATPLTGFSRGTQVFFACLTVGLIGWTWITAVGFNYFKNDIPANALPLFAVAAVALLAYAITSASIGFLLGQLGLDERIANAIANIFGMVLSFLAGAWVPVEYLPDAVVAVSHFTPGYWASQAIGGAQYAASTSFEALSPLLADCGICLLFAAALFAVGLAVGRTKASSAV